MFISGRPETKELLHSVNNGKTKQNLQKQLFVNDIMSFPGSAHKGIVSPENLIQPTHPPPTPSTGRPGLLSSHTYPSILLGSCQIL